MPLRPLNGKQIFVESEGEEGRPAVLFLHGLGGTTTFFEAQARVLAGTHRVVRFDLPGHGRSPPAGHPTMESIAEDAVALLDVIGVDEAIVVGHSMSTIAALRMAERHAQRVAKLVLLGAFRELSPAAREATRQRAALVRAQGMEAMATAVASAASSPRTQAERPELVGYIRELLLGQDREGYARACDALAVATAVPLASIRAPTLLIAGADDKIAPPAQCEAMAGELARGKLVVLDGCGHWIAIEAAQRVNAAIRQFV